MLLTIDIGNTNITLGLYEGNELGSFKWEEKTTFQPDGTIRTEKTIWE